MKWFLEAINTPVKAVGSALRQPLVVAALLLAILIYGLLNPDILIAFGVFIAVLLIRGLVGVAFEKRKDQR